MKHAMKPATKSSLMACAILLCTAVLGACAADPHRQAADAPPEKFDPKAAALTNTQIHLDLIRDMIDKGQYYAALAHVQDIEKSGAGDDAVLLIEADCRRHLGQVSTADVLYHRLLGGAVAGEAYHGLGLLYVKTRLSLAVTNLRRAAQLAPTDADIRNDLGRALLESGRFQEALPELSTAAELAPAAPKTRRNLIVLMLAMGNETRAAQLAQIAGTTPAEMLKLRAQAQSLKPATTTPQIAETKPAAAG